MMMIEEVERSSIRWNAALNYLLRIKLMSERILRIVYHPRTEQRIQYFKFIFPLT